MTTIFKCFHFFDNSEKEKESKLSFCSKATDKHIYISQQYSKKRISFLLYLLIATFLTFSESAYGICSGTSTDASQNSFSTGYNYEFSTSGTDVTITFELLDNKTGVVAYTWTKNPVFDEKPMTLVSGKKFTRTFTGQTIGATFTVACKFAFAEAPGMAVTKDFIYTVGDNCSAAALSILGSNNLVDVCEGESVTLSAPNALAAGNYEWYKKANGDASFSLLATTADSTYVVNPTVSTQYYVVHSGETSETLTVNTKYCSLISLTGSNSGADVCEGDATTLTATHSLSGTNYSWYKKANGDASFSLMGTSAVNTYAVTPSVDTQYYVEYASENSDTLTINTKNCTSNDCAGTSTEASQNSFSTGYNYEFSTSGTDVTITFELLDNRTGVVAYTWTKNPGFEELPMTLVSGKKFTKTFTGQTIGATFTVACKFAFAEAPGMAVTKDFTYTVGDNCSAAALSILGSNNLVDVCEGESVTLSAPNALAAGNYEWYKKANGDASFSLLATTADSTYVVNPTVSTQYYVVHSGETSETLTINVKYCSLISLTGSNSGADVCEGDATTLTATHSLSGTTYSWYKKANGDASFSLMGTSAVNTYSVTPSVNTQYYVEYASENSDTLTINTKNCTSNDCIGTSTDKSDGNPLTLGYNYEFTTSGTDVIVTFELLDSKTGINAYAWTMNPGFSETKMTLVSGQKYTATFTGQTLGATFNVACKFEYAGGLTVTKYFAYTVGEDCIPDDLALYASNNSTVCEGTAITLNAPHIISGTDFTWYKKAKGDAVFSVLATTPDSIYIVYPTDTTEYYVEFGGLNSNTVTINTTPCLKTDECFGTVTTDKTYANAAISYNYMFITEGNTVTASVEFPTEKVGLTAWCTINGVISGQLYSDGFALKKLSYSKNFTIGETITVQWDIRWAGDRMDTKQFSYTVGEDCYDVDLENSTNGETICVGNPVTLTADHSISGTDYNWYKKASGESTWTLFQTTSTNSINILPSISTSYKVTFGGEESNETYVSAMICCSESAEKIILYKEDFGTLPSNCARTTSDVVPASVNLQYAGNNTPDLTVNDGFYAVVANPACNINGYDAGTGTPWFLDGEDHTEGDTNGGMLFVNNGTASATIFSKTIKNPCQNTTLEFSSWIANACRVESNCPLPVNLTFRVYGKTGGTWNEIPNSSIETGDLGYISNLTWHRRGTSFNTDFYDSLKVEITNNGSPGWGNDALIDDITLSACSPSINLYTDIATFKTDTTVCNNEVITLTPMAGYDLSDYFLTTTYLLQSSTDSINWTNILPISTASSPNWQINANTLDADTTYYRVIVGNSEATVLSVADSSYSGTNCMLYTISNTDIIYRPTFSLDADTTLSVCEEDEITLTGNTDGIEWQWEDALGNILVGRSSNPALKTLSLIATQDSVIYFRAFDTNNCSKRKKITIQVKPIPTYTFEADASICEGTEVTLLLTITGSPSFAFTFSDGTTQENFSNYTQSTWSKTVTPTSTTTFTISKLRDSNCWAKE